MNTFKKIFWLSLSFSPLMSFALNKSNPWGDSNLGIDLTSGGDAEQTIGDWFITGLWYVAIIVTVMLFVVGIWNIVHVMGMSREEREHSKPTVKLIIAIICLVIGFAIAGFLFMGLANAG